ncbi:hypothetical protein ERJ75_001080600 [Trypanosoma vivax]|nr:hypothetical protein ERJ75_001080600 [Trypanosoma vivax]
MTRGQKGNVDMLRVSAVRGSEGEAASDKGHGSGSVRWAGKAQGTKKEPTSSGNGTARGRGAKSAIGWTWFPEDTVGQGEEQALRSGWAAPDTRRKNELTVFTWEMAKDRSWTCTKQEQEEEAS